ncbi:hypothetical protein Tco_1071230 [Tanacetum coccineum]
MVNATRAKKLEKSHDPLALVAHTGSSSRQTLSYYVTHPTSVVEYDDEYQQDDVHHNFEDPLVSAMLLHAKVITQNLTNLTNNHLCASSNTKNQAIIQGDRDEAGINLTDEHNDFLFANASRMEEIEELSANICLMARIQPSDHSSDDGPSYKSAFISEENVNSGSVEKDTHVLDLYAVEKLARNAYQEAKKQQIFSQQVQTQNTHLTSQLEMYKERVQILENINKDNNYLNEFLEANERVKRYNKQAQSQLVRDQDIIRDLEKQRDKLDLDVKNYKRKNDEYQKTHSILKSNSLQGMFMLGPKPLSVYDQQLKHGLGYPNLYTLKQAISKCPKLYVASSLGNLEIHLIVRDSEDTLEDAFKSQQKMTEK